MSNKVFLSLLLFLCSVHPGTASDLQPYEIIYTLTPSENIPDRIIVLIQPPTYDEACYYDDKTAETIKRIAKVARLVTRNQSVFSVPTNDRSQARIIAHAISTLLKEHILPFDPVLISNYENNFNKLLNSLILNTFLNQYTEKLASNEIDTLYTTDKIFYDYYNKLPLDSQLRTIIPNNHIEQLALIIIYGIMSGQSSIND